MCIRDRFVFCFIFITRIATYSGWTSKPTPRSDTVRLSSNVFKVLGNVDVFLSACIVMMFNTMAVNDKKALKKQLITTNVKFKPSALAIFFFNNPNQCSVSIICKEFHFFLGFIRF